MKKIKFSKIKIKKTYSPKIYFPLLLLWVFVLSNSLSIPWNIVSDRSIDDSNPSDISDVITTDVSITESSSIESNLGDSNETVDNFEGPAMEDNNKGSSVLLNDDVYKFILFSTVIFSLIIIYSLNTRPISIHEFALQTDLPFQTKKKNNGEEKLVLKSSIGEFSIEWSSTKGLLRFWKMNLIFEVSNRVYDENKDQIGELTDVLFLVKKDANQHEDFIIYQKEFRVKFWPKIELQLTYWLQTLITSTKTF